MGRGWRWVIRGQDRKSLFPGEATSGSPGAGVPVPGQIWLFPHHPSPGHRRLVMINKTNNYPVITDCEPGAEAAAEGGALEVWGSF